VIIVIGQMIHEYLVKETYLFIYMKNDDFVVPICILMIAAACHIICNNQRGWRTWVRPRVNRP
jgi:hypothetical protein